MMVLRSFILLAFLVDLLNGSVILDDRPPDVYGLCDRPASRVVTLTPESPPFVINNSLSNPNRNIFFDYCSIVLQSGNQPLIVTFEFRKFELRETNKCSLDFLCIAGVKLCGSNLNVREMSFILPENQRSTVLLMKDYTHSYADYNILVTTILADRKTVVKEPRGLVYSDMYFKNVTYSNRMNYLDRCRNAYPVSILCHPTEPNRVKLGLGKSPFWIVSPNYARSDYPKQCSLVLKSGDEPLVVTIHFKKFFLQNIKDCSPDFICVHGVKYCDRMIMGHNISYILPKNSTSTVFFKTVNRLETKSFKIHVKVRLAEKEDKIDEPRGIADSQARITSTAVTYTPGIPYVDYCAAKNIRQTYILCSPNESNIVKVDYDMPPFLILSPNYDSGDVPSNCSLVLKSGANPLVLTFDLKKLRLKNKNKCSTDYVCVHGVKYCEKSILPHSISHILPENRKSTVFLNTKNGLGTRTIQIIVKVQLAERHKPITEPRSNGEPNSVLEFVDVNYTSGMPYVDFCAKTHSPKVHTVCNQSSSSMLILNRHSQPFIMSIPNIERDVTELDDYCSVVLESGYDPLIITLQIRKFSLKSDYRCRDQYFCLHGAKLCGDSRTRQLISYILPENKQSTILFRMQWANADLPFDIMVFTERANINRTVSEPRGIDSNSRNLSFVDVTYSPGMPYTDTCEYVPVAYELCNPLETTIVKIRQNSPPFPIHSPNWSKHTHTNHTSCSLILASGRQPLILSFNYSKFYLEKSDNCEHNYLCMNGVKLCGHWTKNYVYENILPENSNFTIHLKKEGHMKIADFEIRVTPRKAVKIGRVKGIAFYLSSLNKIIEEHFVYTRGMPYVDKCSGSHQMSTSARETIASELPELNIIPRRYTLCQTSRPNIWHRRDPQLLVLRSPNYGTGHYPNNVNCSLILESRSYPYILTFYFKQFQLDNKNKCTRDFICINGVTLCDDWMTGHHISFILPERSRSTFFFKTDSTIGKLGFEIFVTIEVATVNTQVLEARGDPHSENRFYVQRVAYNPGMDYFDYCSNINQFSEEYQLCNPSDTTIIRLDDADRAFTIRSPDIVKRTHPTSSSCSLILESTRDPLTLFFNYSRFSLEKNEDCQRKYLCMNGVKLCGEWKKSYVFGYLLPQKSNFTIHFKTDSAFTHVNFEIHVTSRRAEYNDRVIGVAFYLLPNIIIEEQSFYTGEMPYEDRCSASYQMPTSTLETITSEIPALIAERNRYSLCQTSRPDMVELNSESQQLVIQSPNYSKGHYPNNVNCSLFLKSGSEPLILTFHFRKFLLDESKRCTSDFLCVNGILLCGNWIAGHHLSFILPENRRSTVYFKTDSAIQQRGFHIIVTTQLATEHTQVLEAIGSPYFENGLYLQRDAYRPGMYYDDQCLYI